ncbi:MAG: DUF4920 domain-containing protein [Deltaproteobacteria bacterium]|nr:DUF4920 domain-containing protein [Deltaproteobacteria bacterium]
MIRKLFALALSVVLLAVAAPALAGKSEGKAYGKPLSKEALKVTVAQLVESPEDYVDKRVQVSGIVTDVCSKRGCWILIGGEDGETVRFKVTDGVIVFPIEAKGKRTEAEGIWTKFELSKEQVIERKKHHAEEKGEKFDPATVTGPETQCQLKGEGAVIK